MRKLIGFTCWLYIRIWFENGTPIYNFIYNIQWTSNNECHMCIKSRNGKIKHSANTIEWICREKVNRDWLPAAAVLLGWDLHFPRSYCHPLQPYRSRQKGTHQTVHLYHRHHHHRPQPPDQTDSGRNPGGVVLLALVGEVLVCLLIEGRLLSRPYHIMEWPHKQNKNVKWTMKTNEWKSYRVFACFALAYWTFIGSLKPIMYTRPAVQMPASGDYGIPRLFEAYIAFKRAALVPTIFRTPILWARWFLAASASLSQPFVIHRRASGYFTGWWLSHD